MQATDAQLTAAHLAYFATQRIGSAKRTLQQTSPSRDARTKHQDQHAALTPTTVTAGANGCATPATSAARLALR